MLFSIAMLMALGFSRIGATDLSQADARLVDLNVVALDEHGHPVTDLTSEDFAVTDAGKPQKIAFFHHRDSTRWQAQPLAPNEFSNRGATGIPHATVILFDMLNEGFGTRGYAVDQITRSLRSLETSDYLYLYILTVDGHLYVVHGLPGTNEEAAQTDTVPWTAQIKPIMDQSLRAVSRIRPFDIDVAVRTQLTLSALGRLALELSRVAGRKNLVWITDGVPVALGPVRSDTGEFIDFTPQLRMLSEGLDRCGVAIYPVRQVIFGGPDGIGDTSSGSGATGGAGTGIESKETLAIFAGMTGGRPNTGKDIDIVIKQAMNDANTSYQIGYYPPAHNWDNNFHKLRVTSRRKDVHIQSKTGYYAWAEPPGARAQQVLDAAASTTFDAAEIGLRANMSRDARSETTARVDVRIDAQDIAFVPDGTDYSGQLRLAVVGYLADGQTEKTPIIPLAIHYSAQQRDEALKNGIDFSQDVSIGQNVDKLRVIVFDRGSNSFGSVTIPASAATKTQLH